MRDGDRWDGVGRSDVELQIDKIHPRWAAAPGAGRGEGAWATARGLALSAGGLVESTGGFPAGNNVDCKAATTTEQ